MNVLSLFDGISCGQQALADAGIPVTTYYASEIDGTAIRVTQTNYPDTVQLGDVAGVRATDLPKIDLLLAGSPCQGFSQQGKKTGFAHEASGLYEHFVRLLQEVQPRWSMLENVQMQAECANRITTDLGVAPIQLNSRYWVPQNRERLYWTNISPQLAVAGVPGLKELMGEGYKGIYSSPHGYFKGGFKAATLAPCITRSGWLSSFFPVQKGVRRKFTLGEVEQLQGLPVGYTVAGGSDTSRAALLGNAWTVPVVASVLAGVLPRVESER